MTLVDTDWTVTRATKVIAYIGDDHTGTAPSYATVIEFHRWLQDLADDAVATGDDELDITNTDPSRRSTDNIITLINGYTIGATEAEHLYDGSIIQNDGDDVWDGIVNFGNSTVQIQLIQEGAVLTDDWWNHRDKVYGDGGLNYNDAAGISHRFMIKTRTAGADLDGRRLIGTSRTYGNTYSEFSINGTARGNNVLALSDATDLNNSTAEATVAGWTGITNQEGFRNIDVDNDGADEYYYSEWNTDQPTRSINDFYERMKHLTADGSGSSLYGLNGELFRGITHQVAISGPSGTFVEPEAISWGTGATAGSGQLLAINSTTAGSTLWMQLLEGVIPAANTITGNGGATATAGTVTAKTVSTPFVGASTGTALIGAYGVGVEKLDLSATDSVIELATGSTITPPNNVTNTVAGVFSGEDRVLVGPWDGTTTDTNGDPAITKDQLSLVGNLTTADVGSIVVSEAIPSDTPASGVVRVTDDDGYERWIPYSSWSTSTFTIDTGHADIGNNNDFNGATGTGSYQATAANDVWIAYIDELAQGTLVTTTNFVTDTQYVIENVGDTDFTLIGASANTVGVVFTATGPGGGTTGTARERDATATFTSVQSGTRNLVVLVRDGGTAGDNAGIKQFISSWSQTSSNQTITAIRTSDV